MSWSAGGSMQQLQQWTIDAQWPNHEFSFGILTHIDFRKAAPYLFRDDFGYRKDSVVKSVPDAADAAVLLDVHCIVAGPFVPGASTTHRRISKNQVSNPWRVVTPPLRSPQQGQMGASWFATRNGEIDRTCIAKRLIDV
jgi:hypothetical protein